MGEEKKKGMFIGKKREKEGGIFTVIINLTKACTEKRVYDDWWLDSWDLLTSVPSFFSQPW